MATNITDKFVLRCKPCYFAPQIVCVFSLSLRARYFLCTDKESTQRKGSPGLHRLRRFPARLRIIRVRLTRSFCCASLQSASKTSSNMPYRKYKCREAQGCARMAQGSLGRIILALLGLTKGLKSIRPCRDEIGCGGEQYFPLVLAEYHRKIGIKASTV